MITDPDGTEWGTAAEIATRLGGGVTHARVRQWARYDGLRQAQMTDDNGRRQVRYPYLDAAEIDRKKRQSGRGRRRLLDASRTIDHTASKHNSARRTACPAH